MKNVIRLYQEVFSELPWNETWGYKEVLEDIRFCQKQKNPIFLVTDYENKIVGFRWAYELPIDKYPFLKNIVKSNEAIYGDELAVKKEFRGKGLGTKMMQISIDRTKELGYKSILGRTNLQSNVVPIYMKLGYVNTGIRDPKYVDRFYFIKRL